MVKAKVIAADTSTAITVEEIEQFVIDAGSDHVPTFGGKYEGGMQIQQIPDEIAPCIMAILKSGEPIKNYLEIGVAAGGMVALINHYFHPGKIVLIDDNAHPKHHIRPYVLDGIERTEIIGHSQAQGTLDVLKSLEIEAFDLIMIDGDHSYPGVSKDVKMYRDFLRPGGFLILHDSVLPEAGVRQVVADLKKGKVMNFIAEYLTAKHARPCGVALFQKGAE